jgi:hypothetical protein
MNHILNKETNRITLDIKAPRILINGKFYIDFTTLQELTELSKSKLYRKLQTIDDLSSKTYSYKNRIFYSEIILIHFRYQ